LIVNSKSPKASIRFNIVLLTLLSCGVTPSQNVQCRDALKQKPEWYATDEAINIADKLLLYQRNTGGWPKNIDMASALSKAEEGKLLKQKTDIDSTIDNSATYTQLIFLARVFNARKDERHRAAFLKGLDYLLSAQYANGGWPQYYPDLSGYFKHITYNDDAMIGVMKLLRDIASQEPEFKFVDEERRVRAKRAVQKGVECILKTQVVVNGKRTAWCAQHDEVTLAPAPARSYEPISLSGGESVGIVRFLMSMKSPSPGVIAAIQGAVSWFELVKLNGIKWVEQRDPSKTHGFDRVVVKDPGAGPVWARFYEVSTNRPIFLGRDGVVKYDVAQIEEERRTGYAWYVDGPGELLSKDYPDWLSKNGLR
jgi:PelA/Pel-15E family pectate lyase